MIDYEKLKEANIFAQELAHQTKLGVYVQIHFTDKMPVFNCHIDSMPEKRLIDRDVDTILEKLRELTKTQPKYKIGDTVFHCATFGTNSPIVCSLIESIDYISDSFVYILSNSPCLNEDWLYPTREALIDAQIEHWQSLLNNETSFPRDRKL